MMLHSSLLFLLQHTVMDHCKASPLRDSDTFTVNSWLGVSFIYQLLIYYCLLQNSAV